MKPFLGLALAAVALATLAPTALAQDPTGVSLLAQNAGTVPFEGSGSFPVELTVGCALILQEAPGFEATVAAVDAPAWITVESTTVSMGSPDTITGCASSGGEATFAASVPFTVTAAAPGVAVQTVNLAATVGSTTSEPSPGTLDVAYQSNYTVVADAQFPMTVTTPEVTFKVTNTQASNARSMIMIEGVTVSSGVFSGLPSTVYESAAGAPDTKTFDVTFKAPEGEWETATVTFTAFGHYLLATGEAGDYSPGQTYTYEFVNGGVPVMTKTEGKESPAPVAAITALGLLGLVAVLRRKA